VDKTKGPVQALEFTPEKKVVWALRSWTSEADLGPATTVQILGGKDVPEAVRFGEFR